MKFGHVIIVAGEGNGAATMEVVERERRIGGVGRQS
jgi:hypothetical protein